MATMKEIEAAASEFATKRAALAGKCISFQQELEAVRARHVRGLRETVAAAKESHASLCALIQESPSLFERPRSVVLHGVKLGFVKQKGKMTIEDEDKTVALIRKHFAEQAEVLITTIEKPAKEALAQLSAADLKRVAVVVSETGDAVFAKDTAAEVDKLVAAFLKDDEPDEADRAAPVREAA